MILEISLFSVFNILAAVIYAAIREYKTIADNYDGETSQHVQTAPSNQLFSVNQIPALSVADAVNVYVIPVTHFRGEPSEEIAESLVDSRSVGIILVPESDSSSTDSSDEDDGEVTQYAYIENIDDNSGGNIDRTESDTGQSNNDTAHVGERENFILWRRAANALPNRTRGLRSVVNEVMELREIISVPAENMTRNSETPDGNIM